MTEVVVIDLAGITYQHSGGINGGNIRNWIAYETEELYNHTLRKKTTRNLQN